MFFVKPHGQIITIFLLMYVRLGIKADDFFCQATSQTASTAVDFFLFLTRLGLDATLVASFYTNE